MLCLLRWTRWVERRLSIRAGERYPYQSYLQIKQSLKEVENNA